MACTSDDTDVMQIDDTFSVTHLIRIKSSSLFLLLLLSDFRIRCKTQSQSKNRRNGFFMVIFSALHKSRSFGAVDRCVTTKPDTFFFTFSFHVLERQTLINDWLLTLYFMHVSSFKATTGNFCILSILEAPVDKSAHVSNIET